MLREDSIATPAHWLPVTSVLTDALASGKMTTRDDLIVQIVDDTVEGHDSMPIAWHVPATSAVVLNASKIKGMNDLRHQTKYQLNDLAREWITADRVWSYDFEDGMLLEDSGYYDDATRAMIRIRGVLAHEAAHSMFSHYLLEDWWQEIEDPRIIEVITMLDEVRIEGLQADRSDDYRSAMRLSARMLLPTSEDVEDMRTKMGMLDMFKMSLNMALTLGRRDQGMLLEYEVREIRYFAEDLFGFDRLEAMREIWNEFAEIADANVEKDLMIGLAEEWIALFDDDEEIALPGFLEYLLGLFGALGEGAEKWAGNKVQWGSREDTMPAKETAEKVFKGGKCKDPECPICTGEHDKEEEASHGYARTGTGDFSFRKVKPAERAAASALAKRLERLSVRARSEVKVRSVAPPGRLKSRAAVAQSAARSQGRASTAEPWQRTKRKHNDTPPLTVGIITDVSGSMGWAEEMVASASWIVNKAVRHVNGTSAAAVFGERAEPIIGPADKLTDRVIVREACDGSEAFNEACAAVDGVLRLSDSSNGARILFVISDGYLVAPGEMAAAAKWVERLSRSGCAVIWISREDAASMKTREYQGYPACPKGARYMQARTADIAMVNKMVDEVAKALASR